MMSSEEVNEVKNEEVPEVVAHEIIETTNEEQPTEQIKEEPKEEPKEETKPIAKAKAVPKKLARTVKVVELVECSACNKKMLPKSLKNTHPHYCKGQPTETLPVNKQKASYGSKVEQKLRKEIEDEMRKKYETKNDVVTYSEPIEVANAREVQPSVKTKQRPVRMEEAPPPKQPTATELLQQSYYEMKRLRQQEKQEKINKFRVSMF